MIRRAIAADAEQLAQLMYKLATLEGYAARFAVTPEIILQHGFIADAPQFVAWVVDDGANTLHGYAVIYITAFTFDLRPTIVLKELFVEEHTRGQQYGRQLFAAVRAYAQSLHGRLLRWQVLPGNDAAKSFYRQCGGRFDSGWENWLLDLDN